jgi:hypothetical protein
MSFWYKNTIPWNAPRTNVIVYLGADAKITHHDSANCTITWGNLYAFNTIVVLGEIENDWQYFTVTWDGSTATRYRNGEVYLTGSYSNPQLFNN